MYYRFPVTEGRWDCRPGDASVSLIKKELQLSDEQYETFIDYPRLSGMKDKEKENRFIWCYTSGNGSA